MLLKFSRVLKSSSLLASKLLLCFFVFGQSEIGVQLYTFRNQIPKDVPGMLQKISNMGIRELEGEVPTAFRLTVSRPSSGKTIW